MNPFFRKKSCVKPGCSDHAATHSNYCPAHKPMLRQQSEAAEADTTALARQLAARAVKVQMQLRDEALALADKNINDAADKMEMSRDYAKLAHMLFVLTGDAKP